MVQDLNFSKVWYDKDENDLMYGNNIAYFVDRYEIFEGNMWWNYNALVLIEKDLILIDRHNLLKTFKEDVSRFRFSLHEFVNTFHLDFELIPMYFGSDFVLSHGIRGIDKDYFLSRGKRQFITTFEELKFTTKIDSHTFK